MNLNFNFTEKTTLSDWWKIVRDNFTAVKNAFETHKDEFETHKDADELDHPDGSVKQRHIADGAVGTNQIQDGAVTTKKLPMYSVTASHLCPSAVQTPHIHDQHVTKVKLETAIQNQLDAFQEHLDNPAGELGDGQVTTSKIEDAAVTAEKIHPNAINTFKIIDGAVTRAKIADTAVNADKIANGSVTEDKIDDTSLAYMMNYYMDTRTGIDCTNNFNRASWQSNWYSYNSRYGQLVNAPSDTTTYKDGYIHYIVLVVPIDVDTRIQVAFNLGSHRKFWRIIGASNVAWTEVK